jgi:hypothetical protein
MPTTLPCLTYDRPERSSDDHWIRHGLAAYECDSPNRWRFDFPLLHRFEEMGRQEMGGCFLILLFVASSEMPRVLLVKDHVHIRRAEVHLEIRENQICFPTVIQVGGGHCNRVRP